MRFASDKFIFTVMDSEMFVITNIYQTIIASPAIGMNHTVYIHTSPYERLQRGCFDIGYDLCIDSPFSF